MTDQTPPDASHRDLGPELPEIEAPFVALEDPTPAVSPDGHFARRLRETLSSAHSASLGASPGYQALVDAVDQQRRNVEAGFRVGADGKPFRLTTAAPIEPAASERHRLPVEVTPIAVDTEGASATPYLCVTDGQAALDYYARALGAEVQVRVVGPNGEIGHAEFTIGSARFFLSEAFPDQGMDHPAHLGGTSVTVHLEVNMVDQWFLWAAECGAEMIQPPETQVHGHRTAIVLDPFGHRWMYSSKVRDVSLEEYAARQEGWRVLGPDDDRPPTPPPTTRPPY